MSLSDIKKYTLYILFNYFLREKNTFINENVLDRIIE